MPLREELSFPHPFKSAAHEALLNIVVTAELLTKEGDRILRPLGLTESQFNVMMVLKHQAEGNALSQTRLGDRLVVNRSNVTGLVDRMEKGGLVSRSDDPNDRRIKMIRLTTEGKKILDQAEKVYIARVEEVMGELKQKEWSSLTYLLEQIRKPLWETLRR